MESIGQKLTSARESLGISIAQIARETNIAKSYLTALENEDFDSFPGETYVLGFLRNYSEYLSLDPEEMISLYRNMKIQEQPAPMEELLVTRKPLPQVLIVVIIIIAALGLGAAGYFLVYPKISENRPAKNVQTAVEKEPVKENEQPPVKLNVKNTYEFADEVLEKRFDKGDAVSVVKGENSYQLYIADIDETVKFIYPQGEIEMRGGEEELLDLNGDSSPDIRILLRSFNADSESLVLHIDRFVQSSGPREQSTMEESPEADTPAAATPVAAAGDSSEYGRPGAPSRAVEPAVIRDGTAPEAFTLNIIFRGYCLFRYESDGGQREERYFHKGETFRLDADSNVRIWASNAGALAAKVNGVDLSLGGSGEVAAHSIEWKYNSAASKYQLQLIPVY